MAGCHGERYNSDWVHPGERTEACFCIYPPLFSETKIKLPTKRAWFSALPTKLFYLKIHEATVENQPRNRGYSGCPRGSIFGSRLDWRTGSTHPTRIEKWIGAPLRRVTRRRVSRAGLGGRSRTPPRLLLGASWRRGDSGTTRARQIGCNCCPRWRPRVLREHPTVCDWLTCGPCCATAAAVGGASQCGGSCCIFPVRLTFCWKAMENANSVGFGFLGSVCCKYEVSEKFGGLCFGEGGESYRDPV